MKHRTTKFEGVKYDQRSVPVEQHRSWISIKHLTTKSAGKHTAWSDVSYGGEYNMENNKA